MSPATAAQAQSTANNIATDNTSIERLLVPEPVAKDTPKETGLATARDQTIPADREAPKRKTRAVKGKGEIPPPSCLSTLRYSHLQATPFIRPCIAISCSKAEKRHPVKVDLRSTVGEEAFLGLGGNKEESSNLDYKLQPMSQAIIKRNHNKILCKNIKMATLRGDTNSVEMLKGLLHTKIAEEDQPTRGTRCLPKFKRNPMKVNPSIYAGLVWKATPDHL
ncbi:uncharacterized protein PGTG_22020 [Puccinia graminis f. sp. tritici CRL 75-36-700-3]|uniref:Uncharacterized protein n=1 Tax=Puccinia graminis f. sp. tritici (strain CRL 75-36-700-3 / race SCCL) TaxID=418459 RepID=H6QTA8_PUCGT|nr:uncharacterized protein PGTG_22020 [Puccinia graminis f. sp. tritici CRL 75-36-700-3]EHS64062.1 hypothetical protein PGTG_22020 [Puccinia graminis f. sp. tritici CRL 75-36-700-3]